MLTWRLQTRLNVGVIRLSPRHILLAACVSLVLIAVASVSVGAQVTPDSTAPMSFSSTAGSTTSSGGVKLTIPSDTNVMGFKFDLQFNRDTFTIDSTSYTAGDLLTTNATGNETFVFIVDLDSSNLRPTATVSVIGVRMQSNASNKGLSNATFNLLTTLKFIKLNTDTTFAGQRDTIVVTNFTFRDSSNNVVASSKATISLNLFLLLLRRGADFNGDGSQDANDAVEIYRVVRGQQALGTYADYGSAGDGSLQYENRTSDSSITAEDVVIFLRYLRGQEI